MTLTADERTPPDIWYLVGLDKGPHAERLVSVNVFPFVVGRSPASNCWLPHGGVSKRHAEFLQQHGKLILRDLQSTNGTFVNGRRIEDDTPLIPGETLHFGEVGFFVSRWELEDASSTVPSNPLKSALDAEVQCRRHAEQALWNCVVKTGAIVGAAAEGIITLDSDGRLETLNAAAERLFGYATHEVLGRHVSLLTADRAGLSGDAYMNRYFRGRAESMERETLGRRKDGETFPLRLSVSEVELAEGRAFVIVLRDLTLEKQTEDTLRRAKLAAEAANQAKGRFLANISHEIRTPMTAILGFAEQLLIGEDMDQAPRHRVEAIRTIQRNGEHLLALINEILDLSKIEAGKFEIQRVDCSPWQVVEDVRQLLQIRADAKQLDLQTACQGLAPSTIVTDPKRLRQILVNFVDNAIKFTDRGHVRLTMCLAERGEGSELTFAVEDTGIGMKSEHMGLLFEPFTQADTSSTRRFGGTGLGMSISQRLAELLGGRIEVESQFGRGSVFRLILPIASLKDIECVDQGQLAGGDAQQHDSCESQPVAPLDCHVLLAEDAPDLQRLLSVILQSAGAEVQVAANGRLAVELAQAATAAGKPFEIVLMDMQMPVLDGYGATRQLREHGFEGPILALTAGAMPKDQRRCLDAGCDEFLAKPVDRKTLCDRVHAAVSAAREKLVVSR